MVEVLNDQLDSSKDSDGNSRSTSMEQMTSESIDYHWLTIDYQGAESEIPIHAYVYITVSEDAATDISTVVW